MKTTILKTGLIVILAFLTACSKENKNDPTPVVTTTTYSMVNGSCIDMSTNTPVPQTYCGTVSGSSQYFTFDGYNCIFTQTGQRVNPAYCHTNPFIQQNGSCFDTLSYQYVPQMYCTANGGSTIPVSKVCIGQYIYNGSQPIQCYGQNCRGYTLQELSTNQTVTCL